MVPFESSVEFAEIMQPGHVFTIEPIVCEGTHKHTYAKNVTGTPDNGGFTFTETPVTADGGWTASFRATVLVTETGAEIL